MKSDPTLESPASSGIPFFWRDHRPQGGTCSLVREIDTPTTRRWLYRVAPAVRYTTDFSDYAEGDLTTEYLVVSQGRSEDTAVFPADETGRILDMLGFGSTFMGWWIDPNVMLMEVGFDLDIEATP